MNDLEEVQRYVDMYCKAIKNICEPLNIEVVDAYLDGNKVLVVKFNPSLEEKNAHEFDKIEKLKQYRIKR